MTTGQTMLALGALVILTSIMLNFYRIFGSSWDTMDSSQIGIDATTIATSYMEVAHGLAFDESVLDSNVIVTSPSDLRYASEFGPPSGVTDISQFTAFEHFHGFEDTTTVQGLGTYVTNFDVYYVFPDDVQTRAGGRTYTKRMDMNIWRIAPPMPATEGIDTVRMWIVMGYYSFQ
jgi:hypothetical protein